MTDETGTPRNMRVLYNFYPAGSADGMSIDTQGNLYEAAGLHRTSGRAETLDTKCGVYVISPQGKLLNFIRCPRLHHQHPFVGTEMKTLYITAGRTLYKICNDIAGLPR